MSNLPKYRSTIEEHVKLSQQLLGIGGDAFIEAPVTVQDVPSQEKVASEMDDESLIAKLAESEEGRVLLTTWDTYGRHLGNVKFAEDSQDPGLVKSAEAGLNEFLANNE